MFCVKGVKISVTDEEAAQENSGSCGKQYTGTLYRWTHDFGRYPKGAFSLLPAHILSFPLL